MYLNTCLLAAAMLHGTLGAVIEQRQVKESCGLKPGQWASKVCRKMGRHDPQMVPLVTLPPMSYDQCQLECHRNPYCGYTKWVNGPNATGSCYFGEDGFGINNFVADNSTGFLFTERECYDRIGTCDVHNSGFEQKQLQDKWAHPWVFNLQDGAGNASVQTFGTSGLGFPQPPQGKSFLAVQLQGYSHMEISQNYPFVAGKTYKLYFSYNFKSYKGDATPVSYYIRVGFCENQATELDLNVNQANGQWQFFAKDIQIPDECAIGGMDRYQTFFVNIGTRASSTTKAKRASGIALFGIDAIQLLPFQM